ncbi:hypothetical protein K1T71_008282 [Dendrolimus kikuchii]|uniref:Uncharacterized protein n=1 Tax=Dendrolimus kikuchii TaxID=765133 RepID=A0ACC1CWS8_9NEOP|nr:hypothetical protein K1T71_008282 [Dendrolimus kikuchii]
MEEKMESEHSYSGDSSSSSDSSSGSSEGEEETTEPVRILGHSLELPQELCEDYSVFKEFFSMKTWESLEDNHKEQLMDYLPKFTANDKEEKEKTIKMLFTHEPFHFTSPLSDFYNNLRQGNYRPDIAKMRKFLIKARAKQQRHKIKSYYAKLLPEVLISRERLLAAAKAAPPGPIPSLPLLPPKPPKNNYKPVYLRARQRYFEELTAIRSEVGGEISDDDNYPEGPPEQARKRKQINPLHVTDGNISGTLGGSEQSFPNSLERLKNVLASHRIRRQYRENHPELNTTGITLEDIKQRVALVNGAKKLMFGGQKIGSPIQKIKRGPKKEPSQKTQKGNDKNVVKKGKEDLNESADTRPLLPNIKIKSEPMESDSESSSFVDPISSPKHSKKSMEHVQIKQEVVDTKYPHSMNNMNYNDPKLESVIKQEPQDSLMALQNSSRVIQPIPIKLEDLDGIDMMALPVELADDSGEVIQVETSTENAEESMIDIDESLTETTHANFLSLVRALFPARAAHRASKQQLHARCAAVMRSAIAPLNTWYNLSDDWCAELDSALDFLAGERGPHPDDFVPYLQFIPETQMYQWIGAGRDCDAILGRLCERWLRSATPPPPTVEPPPPRYPTSWVVRAPTSAEVADFRAQERRRFSTAAKPFTYVQYGFRSVVGPCARWWGAGGAGAAGGSAGAALVTTTRPRHAVFAALVRDAVARLPNGEGTRHDVLTLLKMSQWIVPSNDQALLSAVSSTLDKLQSAKRDPIVKYDQRTAVWTYLHRHRTEEDWLKSTGKGRNSNKANTNQAVAITTASSVLPPPSVPVTTQSGSITKDISTKDIPTHCLEVEVGSVEELIEASDSDVDVDDSSTSSTVPHLSSAQLLIQATKSQSKPQPLPQKPKGKLVATPPPKPKAQPKQTTHKPTNKQANLMTQSVKQANLIAQSVKQASLITQATKSTQQVKTSAVVQSPKQTEPVTSNINQKQNTNTKQTPKQSAVKQNPTQVKTTNVKALQITKSVAQLVKPSNQSVSVKQSASSNNLVSPKQSVTQAVSAKQTVSQAVSIKQSVSQAVSMTNLAQVSAQLSKSLPSVVTPPQKSPLIKQRPLLKTESSQPLTSVAVSLQTSQPTTNVNLSTAVTILQNQNKVIQGTRSLLIRPPVVQTTVTAVVTTSTTQVTQASRRGVVRVLSPATPSSGKSLISPRALMQSSMYNTIYINTSNATAVVSSVATVVSPSVATRTVQLASGRTVQLANQTVHLPGGQAVQLTSGHTLQLSSLQLPTHSVRLPSGQTVQLATSQSLQTVRVPTTVKTSSPRPQTTPIVKNIQTTQATVQIPVSTVQLAGQTVQIAGQTVQLAGQSVQLTGHTVKLPSGQSVQVASQSVLPSQSVQLPSGQTVQLAGNVQTVQLSGSSVQIPSGQSVQLGGQTVQLAGQTMQLGGQTVQLPSGQTIQLSSGQTVQLSSGQTLQLASGQTVQLANQTAKPITQVVRSQTPADKTSTAQPIVAKLLTNSQGQMISLEGVVGGVRPRPVRLLSPAARLPRPLLLTAHKPLHNIILQQSDGTAIRVTSSGGITSSQSLVLSNLAAQTITTSSSSPPVLKLQQVNPIQQVKLAHGIKIQQAVSSASVSTPGVRSVLMDGQQLKLVGGRHVLARILRPSHPPQ